MYVWILRIRQRACEGGLAKPGQRRWFKGTTTLETYLRRSQFRVLLAISTRPTSRNTSSVTNTRIPCKHQAYPHPLQDSLFSTEGTLDLKLMKILVSLLSKAPERKRHAHSNHQSSGYCVADGDWDQVLKQNVQEGYGSAFTLQRDGCMKQGSPMSAHPALIVGHWASWCWNRKGALETACIQWQKDRITRDEAQEWPRILSPSAPYRVYTCMCVWLRVWYIYIYIFVCVCVTLIHFIHYYTLLCI